MQITDLLVPERVALNVQVTDKAMAEVSGIFTSDVTF